MELTLLNKETNTIELTKDSNHAQILKDVEKYLSESRFNHVVTAANITEVKKDNAELNKTKNMIKEVTKVIVDRESETINQFKTNSKEYQELIENKRLERVKDIEVFENQTKIEIVKLSYVYLNDNIGTLREEFNKIDLSDMTKLSYLTGKGALTSAAKKEIDSKIQVCMNNQNRYDLRVSQLANLCYENGLESPMTEQHIQGIVFIENDTEYQEKLNNLIKDEINRVAQIKANIESQKQKELEQDKEQELNNRKNKIRSIFENAYTSMNLSLDQVQEYIVKFANYDFEAFGDLEEFAKGVSNNQIRVLKQIQYAIEQKNKAYESKKADVPRGTNETQLQSDKEVIYLNAKLQFLVKKGIDTNKVCKSVTEILNAAGLKDSIISVEVCND